MSTETRGRRRQVAPPPADDEGFEAWVFDRLGAGGHEQAVIAALFARLRMNQHDDLSTEAPMSVQYPRQIVVRVDADLHDRLVADAEAHGRTVAQSVRLYLRRALGARTDDSEGAPDGS